MEQFTPICEVQSDKAAVEISSRYDGVVSKLYYQTGDVAKVGSPLVDIETDEAEPSTPTEASPSVSPSAAPPVAPITPSAPVGATGSAEATFATPAVRRIAKEHKIDLKKVKGTGPQQRILKGDVLAYLKQDTPAASTAGETLKPLTPIQKAMFKSMTKSLSIPHFGYSDEIRLDALSQFRSVINQDLSGPLKKISYMPLFLKAASLALKEYPLLNACLRDQQLLYRDYHHISIAMDTPQGSLS